MADSTAEPLRAPRHRLPRVAPGAISAVLLVALLANSTVLVWRWLQTESLPPSTYYEFQIQRWEAQLASTPEDPLIWATLGGLYREAGDGERSDAAFGKALDLDPNNVAALLAMADEDIDAGRFPEARRRLKRALDGLPVGGRGLTYFRLGELEEMADDVDAAVKAYEASVNDSGGYWNAHYRLAVLMEGRGEYRDALEAARKASVFASERADVRELLERLEKTVGEDEARKGSE